VLFLIRLPCGLLFGLVEERLNVNTAEAADLQARSGVGRGIAAAILDSRNKAGPFKDWTDLLQRVSQFPKGLHAQVVF
jgi:DNA uptake protein ComE-like DNA-binding protein